MNVAEVLLDVLAEAGVRQLFGIPGDAINDLVDAVRKQDDIEFVHVAHEEAGALAASAQGKLTGGLAACVGTSGPGAIHLLNGLYDAQHDGAPVIAITGQVERRFMHSDYHQEVDLEALFEDVSVFNATLSSPDQLPALVVRACRTALARRGVAHISVPSDLMSASVPAPRRRGQIAAPRSVSPPDEADLDRAAELLDSSQRVTILAGVGCRGATAELVGLARKLKAPIVRSLRAKELIPDDHPLSLGGHGLLGTRPAAEAIDDCEVLLVVGSDFPYSDFYPEQAEVIQVDLVPERIGGRHPVSVGIAADARLTLRGLMQRVGAQRDEDFLASHQESMQRWLDRQSERETDDHEPIRPQRVARTVGELAGADTIFTCDTGAVTVWGARNLSLRGDARFTLSSGLGTMGYALPAAIGAQLAYPNRRVVALVGDGSMQMLLGEFLTAVAKDLPITVVVFDNRKLGLIQMEQESSGFPESETRLPDFDYAAFAELAGGAGIRVERVAELEPSLRRALESNKPCVVDVVVNPEELTLPPRVELQHALGFLRAKAKEFLGMGDKSGGVSVVIDSFS